MMSSSRGATPVGCCDRVVQMLQPYKAGVAVALAMSVLSSLSVLAGPFLLRLAVDHPIADGDVDGINRIAIAYVIIAVSSYFFVRIQIMVMSRVGENFLRDLRLRVFDHLQRLSMPFYDREKAGVLVSRMTSDIDSLAELVQMGLLMIFTNVLLLVFATIALAATSWQLFLVVLAVIPFVALASVKFQRDSNKAYLTVRDGIANTLTRLQEGISGVRVIQAFGRQEQEIERFQGVNEELYGHHMVSVRIQAWYLPVIELAGLGTTAVIIGVGGWLAIEGVVTLGSVVFFVQVLFFLFEPVNQLSNLFNTLQSSGAGLKKLFELLDAPVDVPERHDAVDLPTTGDLTCTGVTFAYREGPNVLSDVNLTIHEGEKLALVGPTGAGKSTLAKLAARMYDPEEGSVAFGGVDLRDCTKSSLRDRIVRRAPGGFPVQRNDPRQHPDRSRRRHRRRNRSGVVRHRCARSLQRHARRPRHRGSRAGLAPQRGREAAGLLGARCAGGPGGSGPR